MTRCDLSLGFVGLGALGLPMAINLHRAGFRLRVHTRSRTAETSPELGEAHRCSNPADTSVGVDVLLVCVSDDAAVEEVLFGTDGAASQLTAGSVVLDCSTIAPATAQSCAQRLAHQNVHYLDAPVTGGSVSEGRARLDFDLPDPIDKEAVTEALNKLIQQDQPRHFRWITDEELQSQPELVRTMSVSPPIGQGEVRLVEFEQIDLQPCGGTHVARSGEIGEVRVSKIEKKGKQNRRVIVEFA